MNCQYPKCEIGHEHHHYMNYSGAVSEWTVCACSEPKNHLLLYESSPTIGGHSGAAVLEDDPVNHPSHYTQYNGLEVIDLTEQMNFNRGNAVKYICRAGAKSTAAEVEDLKKALWYINREIERIQSQ